MIYDATIPTSVTVYFDAIRTPNLYVASDIETNRSPRIPDTLKAMPLLSGDSIIIPSDF